MRHAVFVAPYLARATMRFVAAAARIPGIRCGIITQEPVEKLPDDLRRDLAGHWRVDNALDPEQLVAAARGITGQLGGLDRMLAILEQVQEPLAIARQRLGLTGMDPQTATNFRDKNRMKSVLKKAGLPCARHLLITRPDEAHDFVRQVGFPLVVKPPAGAGAASTFRVDDEPALRQALAVCRTGPERPTLLEEYMHGQEFSFDSIMVDGRVVWHSFSHYLPSPLDVLRNPWIQWCVLLPRDISTPRYQQVGRTCADALRALGLRDGMTHMEWFMRTDGTMAISEVAARPPGAQFTSLLSYAHDLDFYQAWCRLMILDEFQPPARKYAVGAAYFRGQGTGRVAEVHGLDRAQAELGDLVVESRIPVKGQPRSDGYEGDGYAILRHPDTATVERALARVVSLVRVELRD